MDLQHTIGKGSPFTRFANVIARATGRPWAFIAAVLLVILWSLTFPLFESADTWQLVINTSTTIVTFLMVFLIQNTQNRDTEALHIKLDELIRATSRAENALLDIEELDERELDAMRKQYEALAEKALAKMRSRQSGSDESRRPSQL